MSNVGRLIYGYCNGYFGRDDYKTKIIIFETETAIVCRYLDEKDNYISVANFDSIEEKQEKINEWSKKPCNYYGNDDNYF